MSYKSGVIKAIDELNEPRLGSSLPAIKKHMQASMPSDKKWLNALFLTTLKKMADSGELVQMKGHYKLSADFKKKRSPELKAKKAKKKVAPKPKTAPKKNAAAKKKTKKSAPKKKAVSKKKSTMKKSASKKTAPKARTASKTKTTSKKKSASQK